MDSNSHEMKKEQVLPKDELLGLNQNILMKLEKPVSFHEILE